MSRNANEIHGNGKGIASYSQNLKVISHNFIRSTIENIFTDHKNIACKNFNTDNVLRWRLILEEYSPEIEYISGKKNIVAYVPSQ